MWNTIPSTLILYCTSSTVSISLATENRAKDSLDPDAAASPAAVLADKAVVVVSPAAVLADAVDKADLAAVVLRSKQLVIRNS